jgi:hypothetical protein
LRPVDILDYGDDLTPIAGHIISRVLPLV